MARALIVWMRTLFLPVMAVLLVLLAACDVAPPRALVATRLPTQAAPADTPVIVRVSPAAPDTPVPVTAVVPTDTPTPTLAPPTPDATGVRPSDVQQRYAPDAGLLEMGLRPPPMVPPVALHPDDHYWLMRPIPSRSRNFALEWYPYGNNVLRADRDPYRVHHGLDFPNDEGTPVLAAGRGKVIYAGVLPSPRNGVDYYGNTIVIQHDWQWNGQDVYTLYAHTLELFVREGDRVTAGQLIAGVGSSGEVSASHLHFEVRIGNNNYNDTRNPALWLVPFEGWGTLAGRFIDRAGAPITDAWLTLTPLEIAAMAGENVSAREVRTYAPSTVRSDEVWRENFVFGDLPAGRYRLILHVGDVAYQRDVTIHPGRTSFELVGADIRFEPTPTPPPTATPTPTPTATAVVDP